MADKSRAINCSPQAVRRDSERSARSARALIAVLRYAMLDVHLILHAVHRPDTRPPIPDLRKRLRLYEVIGVR
jgi:hypothetical protein